MRRGPVLNGIQLGGEPIQSGLLVPVPVLEQLGLFQGTLFIDGVDSEYFLRCEAEGLRTVLAPNAALNHALGSPAAANIFGRDVSVAGRPLNVRTAADWRYYYLFRNRILLARQYGRRFPLWTFKGLLADYRHLAIVTLLAPGRGIRLANALRGVADGVRGVSGRRAPAAYSAQCRSAAFLARRMTGRSMRNQLAAASGIVHSVAATVNHDTPQWYAPNTASNCWTGNA